MFNNLTTRKNQEEDDVCRVDDQPGDIVDFYQQIEWKFVWLAVEFLLKFFLFFK